MLAFDHIEALLLCLLLIPAIWVRHFRAQRGTTISIALSNWNGDRFEAPITWQSVLNAFSHVVFWFGCLCLVVAVSGPAIIGRDRVFVSRGLDILVVMDCSPSMAAQDFGGKSRLERASETIRSFVHQRENDSIGLLAFGSAAVTKVPPTLDYRAIDEGLDSLRVMELGDGTAIGLGLALAGAHLQHSTATRRIVILVTDGENNTGEISPEVAASLIRELGISLYVIGIGSSAEVPLEYVDPVSGKLYRGTYQGEFGGALLAGLAAQTGGQFIAATGPGTLESGFQIIDTQEKVENRVSTETKRHPLTGLLVALAVFAILGDVVVRRLVLKEIL